MKHFVRLIGFLLFLGLIGCDSNGGVGPDPDPEPDPEPKADHTTGDLVIDLPNGAKMAFMWIDPGKFIMGTSETEQGQFQVERPPHQVTLTKGFYFGKYEVTQWQWRQIMGTQPWRGSVNSSEPDAPVFNISWEDAETFIERLNSLITTHTFRFPTEAEWEYACRAGTTTRWSFGNIENQLHDYAWYDQNALIQPHRVGLKLPNPWGLYDMHGNVQEYTSDWRGIYSPEPQTDPIGPVDPPLGPIVSDNPNASVDYARVVRGGSFGESSDATRSSARGFRNQGFPYVSVGLRVISEVRP